MSVECNYIILHIGQSFKKVNLSDINNCLNTVAAEFQFFLTCFIVIASSCNRGILRPILGRVGGGAPCLFVI